MVPNLSGCLALTKILFDVLAMSLESCNLHLVLVYFWCASLACI
jgi:hypothetical protein